MRGLQVWSEGRKRRVGAGLKGLPWVARGGKQGKGAAAAAAAARVEIQYSCTTGIGVADELPVHYRGGVGKSNRGA